MEFKEKIVAFIDIIGFKNMVEDSEKGKGKSLDEILEILKIFKVSRSSDGENRALSDDDLDFFVTQISDCAIISAELSDEGVVNLLEHCRLIVSGFMLSGIMCRGFITIGSIYHTHDQVIGTGYQEAYEGESNVVVFSEDGGKTPFIEIGPKVIEYLQGVKDENANKRIKMITYSDGRYGAINPYRFLTCIADSTDGINLGEVKSAIGKLRGKIRTVSPDEDAKAFAKSKYYHRFLNELAQKCDQRIEREKNLSQPFPSGRIDWIKK